MCSHVYVCVCAYCMEVGNALGIYTFLGARMQEKFIKNQEFWALEGHCDFWAWWQKK
jgi:hypothetical protein